MTTDSDFKQLVRARMAETGENYTTARAALLASREEAEAFRLKTLRVFLDAEGRLTSVPVKRRSRVIVLLKLLERFDVDREYPEKEVNDILRTAHDDVAYLRRELVDYGFMTRSAGIYRVADELPERDPRIMTDVPANEAQLFHDAKRRDSDLA